MVARHSNAIVFGCKLYKVKLLESAQVDTRKSVILLMSQVSSCGVEGILISDLRFVAKKA
jgi:hypothetical protein